MSWPNACFIEFTEVELHDFPEEGYIFNPIMINVQQIEYIKPSYGTDPNVGCFINLRGSWIEVKQSYAEVCDILYDQDLVFWFGHKEEENDEQSC